MVNKIDKQGVAGDSGELSDSEEEEVEDVGTDGPQLGTMPVQIPTNSPAPVEASENSYLTRPLAENSEGSSDSLPSDEEEAISIINPIARRQLRRAEQKQERHLSLRLKEKALNNKPP